MKAFKAVQSWDKSLIEFKASQPVFSYFLFALGILLSTAMQFAEPQEFAQKAQPYFIATALLGFIFSTQKTTLIWDKSQQTALLRGSLLGLQRTKSYAFKDISLSIQFINANQPRYEKHIDRDWFVLSFCQKKYLLHTQTKVLDINLQKIRRELGLPENKPIHKSPKVKQSARTYPLIQAAMLAALALFITAAIAVKVAPNFALHRSIENASSRIDRSIVYNAFGTTFEEVVARLRQPYKHESLRSNESLAYWRFEPVTLQIHFSKGKASRMAYICKDTTTRELLLKEIFKQFGGKNEWSPQSIDSDGNPKSAMVNLHQKRTLIKEPTAILLYGYIMR